MHFLKKISFYTTLTLGTLIFTVPNIALSSTKQEVNTKKKVSQKNINSTKSNTLNKKKVSTNTKSINAKKRNEKNNILIKRKKTIIANKNTVKRTKITRNNTIKGTKREGVYSPSSNVIYSVYDLNSSSYLEKSNINSTHSIASLTKLMSSYVFLKHTPSLDNCNIQITEEDRDTLKNTRSHLPKNQDIQCNKILEATLALSDNYAASSLSRHVPNFSRSDFIAKMNEQARKWNMNNTYFADPSGLNPKNKSTANDLTKFLSKIVDTKEFKIMDSFSTSKRFLLPTAGKPRLYSNTNRLIREEKFDAVLSKTGYINESGYNLMFMPKNCGNNKQLALVIMGERTSYNRSSLATKLLNKYNCK